MDTKYYIPDISEFHVGFEYEHCHSSIRFVMLDLRTGDRTNETEPKEIWEKSVFTGNEFDVWKSSFNFDDSLRDGQIRVKYLDKEDIESLGFKEDQEYQSTVDESNYDWHYDYGMESNNKKLKLIYTNWRTYAYSEIDGVDHSKYNEYSVVKIIKSVIAGEEFTAFVGFIKNKSELKRILKMIGYEN